MDERDNNFDNVLNVVNVGNVTVIDKSIDYKTTDEECLVPYVTCKEHIDSTDGTNIVQLADHRLGDRFTVNASRLDKSDEKIMIDLEIICKILKNAMQLDLDQKLMLPKLKEILTLGKCLWNKYMKIEGLKTRKGELEEKWFTDVKGSCDTKKEEEHICALDDIQVKVKRDIINDLDNPKVSEQIDENFVEFVKPPTLVNKTESKNDVIGKTCKSTDNTNKRETTDTQSYKFEGNSDSKNCTKSKSLECHGDINSTLEGSCKETIMFVERKRVTGKTKQESSAKFRWTINRNMRIHKSHRKCLSWPADLDADNYSTLENGYFCTDCHFIFNAKSKFILHKRLKKGLCLRECIYCDADEQKDVYRCTKCSKCFQTKEMLERHQEKHVNVRCCDFCIAEFYTLNDLRLHTQTMHAESIFPTHLCDLCGSKFKERKVLNAHRRFVHSDHKPEACTSCDKRFKTKSQLKNHLVTHMQVSDLNLSCEICGKMFLRVATLKDHVRRHKKDFSCFCTICDKGFYRKYSLEEHMRVHTGDKPFDCKFCGFKCALSCNLVKHMKVHSQHNAS